MLATSSPCTNTWSFVIMTTTDWFGSRLDGRLRNLHALGVLHDLDLGRVHEQERDHDREDVDQRNEVEFGILPMREVVVLPATDPAEHAHDEVPPLIGASPTAMFENNATREGFAAPSAVVSVLRTASMTWIRSS